MYFNPKNETMVNCFTSPKNKFSYQERKKEKRYLKVVLRHTQTVS